jgi:prepilin signal peptidase PulO-like enzyme (type II secretory pathway)
LGCLEGVGEAGGDRVTRLEQRGAVAFAVVIFIALVIAVWGLF